MTNPPSNEAPDPASPTPAFAPDGGRSLMDGLDSAIAQFHASKGQAQAPAADPAPEAQTPAKGVEKAEVEEIDTNLAPEKDKPDTLKEFDNPWEAEIKTEEDKAAEKEAKKEEAVPEPEFKVPAQKAKWGELRQKAEELDRLKPEVTALKAKIAELEKAEPKLPSEVEAKLQKYDQLMAISFMKETEEYKASVEAPMAEVKNTLVDVAEYAGIDATTLYETLDISNTFQRASAIRKALLASENEVSEDAIQMAIVATNEFHKKVIPEMRRLEEKAVEMKHSYEQQKLIEQTRMSEKQQAEFKAASDEVYTKLEANLKKIPGLFDDPKVAEAMKKASLANPSEKPMHAAYQAQVAAVMPYLIQTLNSLIQKNASLEKLAKSRSGAEAGPAAANRQGPAPQAGPDGGKSLMEGLASLGIR